MSDGAPVCSISSSQAVPSQRGLRFPAIPKAMDLPSALQAIDALTQIVLVLSRQQPPIFRNNLAPNTVAGQFAAGGGSSFRGGSAGGGEPGPPGRAGEKGPPGKEKDPKSGSWSETDRKTTTVKIVNPDDNEQFVIVERIESLTFTNRSTGETLNWKRSNR